MDGLIATWAEVCRSSCHMLYASVSVGSARSHDFPCFAHAYQGCTAKMPDRLLGRERVTFAVHHMADRTVWNDCLVYGFATPEVSEKKGHHT